MQEAIGYANGTREIVRVMELSSVGETICSPRGEEDQMINVSRGMKDIKERRGEERRGLFLERANLHGPILRGSLKV
jgi:hypothetical protein